MANVVTKLNEGAGAKTMKVQGERLRKAISSLSAAKTRLPQTENEVSSVNDDLEQLKDSISKLGLETDFGKFLQASVSPEGAAIGMLQSEEVSKQIEELGLKRMFRVRLSS
jgi:hypothetical protein